MRIGIYGGTFDPPHLGHVLALSYAAARYELASLLVVPSFAHPFGKAPVADFATRVALCREAFAHQADVEVSEIEATLARPSYTVDVVEALKRARPEAELWLILGTDLEAQLPSWHRSEALRAAVSFAWVPRAGTAADGLPNIASSTLRARLAQGHPVEAWLPANVAARIHAAGLYAAGGA